MKRLPRLFVTSLCRLFAVVLVSMSASAVIAVGGEEQEISGSFVQSSWIEKPQNLEFTLTGEAMIFRCTSEHPVLYTLYEFNSVSRKWIVRTAGYGEYKDGYWQGVHPLIPGRFRIWVQAVDLEQWLISKVVYRDLSVPSVPPTSVPPPPTSTSTPVPPPPTATSTPVPVPPTATVAPTATPVPPPPTPTPSVTPTPVRALSPPSEIRVGTEVDPSIGIEYITVRVNSTYPVMFALELQVSEGQWIELGRSWGLQIDGIWAFNLPRAGLYVGVYRFKAAAFSDNSVSSIVYSQQFEIKSTETNDVSLLATGELIINNFLSHLGLSIPQIIYLQESGLKIYLVGDGTQWPVLEGDSLLLPVNERYRLFIEDDSSLIVDLTSYPNFREGTNRFNLMVVSDIGHTTKFCWMLVETYSPVDQSILARQDEEEVWGFAFLLDRGRYSSIPEGRIVLVP